MDARLAVRAAHLAAMGVMLGGSALCAWALLRRHPGADAWARAYEWLFWGAAGVSVATGVGNLGALGDAMPAPDTGWGGALRWKLVLLLAGLPVAALRTLVARADLDGRAGRALAALHAATSAGVLAALVLGQEMAHGA